MGLKIVQYASIVNLHMFEDDRGTFECIWEDHQSNIPDFYFTPSSVNFSYNNKIFTLRGMHYQASPYDQAKIVSCINGRLWDVVVDLRKESPTYKKWIAFELAAQSGKGLFIPKGYAHGFLTLEDNTTLAYLIEGRYMPEQSRVLNWSDPEVAINWPVNNPILSDRDKFAPGWSES